MTHEPKPRLNRWGARALQALPVVVLLTFIGFRVYGYFASSGVPARSARESLDSEDIRAWGATGTDAYVNKQWDVATEAFEKVTRREPNNVRAWILLAHSLHQSARYDRALSAYLRVTHFEGRPRRWALANIAAVYAVKGEKRMALDFLQEAVSAGFRQRLNDPPLADDPDFQSIADDPEFQRLSELTKPVAQRNVYRQFDFVIGNWKLQTLNDRHLGSLEFQPASRGYAVVGNGVDRSRSIRFTIMSYYDPEARHWKQVWLDDQGLVIHMAETSADERTMTLEGTLATPDGRQQTARAVFEEAEGGLVRLTLMKSPDAGNRWEDILDAMMTPAEVPPPQEGGPQKESTN